MSCAPPFRSLRRRSGCFCPLLGNASWSFLYFFSICVVYRWRLDSFSNGVLCMVVIYTCIDGIDIPVQPGPLTSVSFRENCEQGDKPGFYDFWTMDTVQGSLTGRFLDGYPGQRFEGTNTARTATLVRPSLAQEVEDWLNNRDHKTTPSVPNPAKRTVNR